MSFVVSSYVLTGFFLLVGAFWFLLAATLPDKKKGFIRWRETFFILGLFYVLLSHVSVYAGLGESLDAAYAAPCENVINSSTTAGNATAYTYLDSCAGTAASPMAETLVVLFTWLLALGVIGLIVAILYLIIGWLGRFI